MEATIYYKKYGEKKVGEYTKNASITSDKMYIWVDASKETRYFEQSVNGIVKIPQNAKFSLYEITGDQVTTDGDDVTVMQINKFNQVTLQMGDKEIGRDDGGKITIVNSSSLVPSVDGETVVKAATGIVAALAVAKAGKKHISIPKATHLPCNQTKKYQPMKTPCTYREGRFFR